MALILGYARTHILEMLMFSLTDRCLMLRARTEYIPLFDVKKMGSVRCIITFNDRRLKNSRILKRILISIKQISNIKLDDAFRK